MARLLGWPRYSDRLVGLCVEESVMSQFVLAIDQGTTSSRAIIFDQELKPVATGQKEFTQIFPDSGWVEHDPEEIWTSTVEVCREAMEACQSLHSRGCLHRYYQSA